MLRTNHHTHPHDPRSFSAKLWEALLANLKLIVRVLLLAAAAALSTYLGGR